MSGRRTRTHDAAPAREPAAPASDAARSASPARAAATGRTAGMGNQAVQRRLLSGGASARDGGGSAGGGSTAASSAPSIAPEPESGEAARALAELGPGEALDQSSRSRMEAALGRDFGGVRVHAGGEAGAMANRLGARSFALGEHVVFGPGQYRPGTLVGEALMAHELAHVAQQQGAAADRSSGGESGARLEEDADVSAIGAVVSLWSAALGGPMQLQDGRGTPRLRSGMRLSRCADEPKLPPLSMKVNPTKLHGSTNDPDAAIKWANEKVYNQAGLTIDTGTEKTLDEEETKAILGDDLILDEFSDPTKPTAEEQALFKVNQTAGAVTSYWVKELSDGSSGESFTPSDGVPVGTVVGNNGVESTFAHELGHVLLDDGGHDVPDDTYLMYESKKKDKYKLTPEQITKIRSSPYAT